MIHDMIEQSGDAVCSDSQLGNPHLSHLPRHQQHIPGDQHKLLFHLLVGHTLGGQNNVAPVGCRTCANAGQLALPFLAIGLPRSFVVLWDIVRE